jgi:hypothetical protein
MLFRKNPAVPQHPYQITGLKGQTLLKHLEYEQKWEQRSSVHSDWKVYPPCIYFVFGSRDVELDARWIDQYGAGTLKRFIDVIGSKIIKSLSYHRERRWRIMTWAI